MNRSRRPASRPWIGGCRRAPAARGETARRGRWHALLAAALLTAASCETQSPLDRSSQSLDQYPE